MERVGQTWSLRPGSCTGQVEFLLDDSDEHVTLGHALSLFRRHLVLVYQMVSQRLLLQSQEGPKSGDLHLILPSFRIIHVVVQKLPGIHSLGRSLAGLVATPTTKPRRFVVVPQVLLTMFASVSATCRAPRRARAFKALVAAVELGLAAVCCLV